MTRVLLRFIVALFVWWKHEGASLTPYESVLAKDWLTEDEAWAYLSVPFTADGWTDCSDEDVPIVKGYE